MMKINELVKTGEREETYEITIPAYFDATKKEMVAARTVTKTKIVPVMEVVEREMTEAEIAALVPTESAPPTAEERLAALEAAVLSMLLGGAVNG